jgi:hypothetical protein
MSQIIVKIYEPPMCCPTGACGPNVNDKLVEFNETVQELEEEGIEVERNSMNNNPLAFQGNPEVLSLVNNKGTDQLPVTEVNGKVIKLGEYPTKAELMEEIKKIKEEK